MKITKYDGNKDHLPEGLEWRWFDDQYKVHYGTEKPEGRIRGLVPILRIEGEPYKVVNHGDLILRDQSNIELVRKDSLTYKFLGEKLEMNYQPMDNSEYPPVKIDLISKDKGIQPEDIDWNSYYRAYSRDKKP